MAEQCRMEVMASDVSTMADRSSDESSLLTPRTQKKKASFPDDDEERQRAKAELMASWREKMSSISGGQDEDCSQTGSLASARRSASVSLPQHDEAHQVRLAELRQTQMERRRKVAESAAMLAKHEEELILEQRRREQIERQKAEEDEAFFTRWVRDSEKSLEEARAELAEERENAAQAQQAHERAIQELRASQKARVEQLREEHSRALERQSAEMDEAVQSSRQQLEETKQSFEKRLAEVRSELAAARDDVTAQRKVTEELLEAKKEAERIHEEMLASVKADLDAARSATKAHEGRVLEAKRETAEAIAEKEKEMADALLRKDRAISDIQHAHSEEFGHKIVECAEISARNDRLVSRLQRDREEFEKARQDMIAEWQTKLGDEAARRAAAEVAVEQAQDAQRQQREAQERQHAAEILRQEADFEARLASVAEEAERRAVELRGERASAEERAAVLAEELLATKEAVATEAQQRALSDEAFCAREAAHADELASARAALVEAKAAVAQAEEAETASASACEALRASLAGCEERLHDCQRVLSSEQEVAKQLAAAAEEHGSIVTALSADLKEAQGAFESQAVASRALQEEVLALRGAADATERRRQEATAQVSRLEEALVEARRRGEAEQRSLRAEVEAARRATADAAAESERLSCGRITEQMDSARERASNAALSARVEALLLQMDELRMQQKTELAHRDSEHKLVVSQCQAQAQQERMSFLNEIRQLEERQRQREEMWQRQSSEERYTDMSAQELIMQVEEAERQNLEADIAWRLRLEAVEHDLRAAQAELWQERDHTRQARLEGEKAVMRTIESFMEASKQTRKPQSHLIAGSTAGGA